MKLGQSFNLVCTYLRCYGLEQLNEELESGSLPPNVQTAIANLLWLMGYYPTQYEYIKEDIANGTLPDGVKERLLFIVSHFRSYDEP